MDTGEVRRRVRRALDDARAKARERRLASASAAEDAERVLHAVAAPLFRKVASALKAEGHRFAVETPAGAVRLVAAGSSRDAIEVALDGSRDPPVLVGRTAYVRGRRVFDDERVVARHPGIGELAAETLLEFVLASLGPLVER